MSTSAADYYKLSYLKRSQDVALDYTADAEEALARVQEKVARCEKRLKTCRNIVAANRKLVEETETELDNTCERGTAGNDHVFDPHTGLMLGEKTKLVQDDGHIAYVTAISNARELMAEGRLQEAMDAEKIATTLDNMRNYVIEPRAPFLSMNDSAHTHTVQVNTAGLVEPRGVPETDEVVDKTLSHAVKLYEDGILDDTSRFMRLVGRALFTHDRTDLPNDVNVNILLDIFAEIRNLETCHGEIVALQKKRIKERREEAKDDGDGGDEEKDGQNDDEHEDDEMDSDDDPGDMEAEILDAIFEMDENGWSAVEIAIKNKTSCMKEANAKELELPTPESSNIARYNPKAHFKFASDEANANVDHLADSLLNCKLRSRPMGYSKENSAHDKVPFQFRTYDNSGFDIDGNIIAVCGDKRHNNIRDEKNFVGFQNIPCPVNLESSTTLCDLQDNNNSNEPWDTNSVKIFEDEKGKRSWFGECIADAENKMVWASCSRTGVINAFSTDYPASGPIAKLCFPETEVKAKSMFANGTFGLVRCGTTIIGSGGTGRLSAWNIKTALKEYDNTMGAGAENIGSDPRIMPVDDNKNFACGDLQCVGNSQLLLGPLRVDGGNGMSSSVRLYDVNAERVVGLFCGTMGEISVGKQYCVESHSSIFAMGNSTGVAFDIRTYQPTVALHTDGSCEQILGVRTNSSAPVAFTYGSTENIMCWDLRMPGSHVYTMATGNTIVESLLWHEGTYRSFNLCSLHHGRDL